MARLLSCGVLLLDDAGELLLCHATGTPRWDVPKGIAEPGESPLAAAVRETAEEAGIALAPEGLVDLGRHAYLRGKDLHLHGALVERLDTAHCRCFTFVRDARGRARPEVDAYAWVPYAEAGPRVAKGLAAILARTLPLDALRARLDQHALGTGRARWNWVDPDRGPRSAAGG